jgi:hypothetical protein
MIQLNSFNQLQKIYKYLRQQRENQRFLNYVEIAATFALISLFLFLAIRPTALAIFSLLGEIKSKESLTAQMKTKINSIVRAQDVYSQVQGNYEIINSSLPDKPRFYQAATNFSAISQNTSSSIDHISFGLDNSDQPSADINTYTVNFTIRNYYSSIVDFINKVLSSRRLVQIDTIQLSKDDSKENATSNAINVNLSTKLFYINDNNEKN